MDKQNTHIENSDTFKNLKVAKGISSTTETNKQSIEQFKQNRRKRPSAKGYFEGIRKGNITLLSQAITLIESSNPKHQSLAEEIINLCLPFSGESIRIGITGVPGVGKSTFIEALGQKLLRKHRRIAVLAIDPSSEKSKGSILGDKTRMENLVKSQDVFVRPSPSSGSLGGVARKTRESIILCEAAGFDTILIETVGVGQSEIAVHSMSDFFLLLMLAGAGDELQGIKRGIMEMADMIAITKADGDNKTKALAAETEYRNALHLFPATNSGWQTKVLSCSALSLYGMDNLWQEIDHFFKITTKNGFLKQKRIEQAKYWMYESINEKLTQHLYQNKEIQNMIRKMEKNIQKKKVNPFSAADLIFNAYLSKK